jgi:hypothetical protein
MNDDLAYVNERIPGYLAYASESERHDSDMRVRAYVGSRLANARVRLAPLDAAVEQALDEVQYRCMFTDQAFVKKFEHASLDAAMEAGLVRADRNALALGERLETCDKPALADIVREIAAQLDYRLSPEPVPAK